MRDGQRMRRREPDTDAFFGALVQTAGYIVLTGVVVWVMLVLA